MTTTGARPVGASWALAALVGLHGAVHFLGAAKGLGLAQVSQLTEPISRLEGVGWSAAAVAMCVTAWQLAARGAWWKPGLPAVVLSQAMIVTAWTDARFGTAANAIILLAAVYALAARGPWSLHADYRQGVNERAPRHARAAPLTEAEVAHLPEPLRRYLRVSGAVGLPRPTHVRAMWRGRIRGSPADAWIPFWAEQHNFLDEPARFFWMRAKRGGVPVDVLHAFANGEATMRARVLSTFTVVDASGPEATRAETVTLLNDVCLLAPGALSSPAFRFEEIDERSAGVHYTVGSNTVSAVLHFDDSGDLVDFVSDDRLVASPNGRAFTRQRWSTPVASYQSRDGKHVMRHGEGRWHPPGEPSFAYIELDLTGLEIDPPATEPVA